MKRKMKILMSMMLIAFSIISCEAQIPNSKTETVKVYGNCNMCKKTIEKAGNQKGISSVEWDADSKMATITYNSKKTTVDDILKKIADSGYDSDKFRASDETYDKLHHCCKYDRPKE